MDEYYAKFKLKVSFNATMMSLASDPASGQLLM